MIPPRGLRQISVALTVVGLISTLWLMGAMKPPAEALAKATGGDRIVGLELAGWRSGEAAEMVDRWRQVRDLSCASEGQIGDVPATACGQRIQQLDRYFIAAYMALLGGLTLLIGTFLEAQPRRRWRWLVAFTPVAGVLDVLENNLMDPWLEAGAALPTDSAARLVAWVATLKFALLGVVGLVIVLVGVVVVRGRVWRRLVASKAVGIDEVLKQERRYLEERRAIAGVKGGGGEIGLAFSGGGIRSATTNLGALQTLARLGLLPRVDYLSTVSGGGYLGSALSSLLSIARQKIDRSASGGLDQYQFEQPGDAYFSTQAERFPFESAPQPDLPPGFSGRTELDHLRTHGDFLIRRQRLIHRDVLRAVGSVLGGIFYHVSMLIVLLTLVSSGYLCLLSWMAGPVPVAGDFRHYLEMLMHFESSAGRPFFVAMVLGFLTLPMAMALGGWVIWKLPDRWFRRTGDSLDESREYHLLWALFFVTLLLALGVTSPFAVEGRRHLAVVLLPMGVYVGGWIATLVLHWLVAVLPPLGRNHRSRFAAWKGVFNYLTMASMLVVLAPFAIDWLVSPHAFGEGAGAREMTGTAWLLSLVGSGLLARPKKGGGEGLGKAVRGLKAVPGKLRNLLLGVLVTAVIVLGLLQISALIVGHSRALAEPDQLTFHFRLFVGVLCLFWFLGFTLDFNKLSLHYFYRDRLVEAYLQTVGPSRQADAAGSLDLLRDNAEMPLTHLHGVLGEDAATPQADTVQAASVDALPWRNEPVTRSAEAEVRAASSAPLHLVVSCLNLTRSRDMTRRSRRSDSFVFSKLFCGSTTTGYLDTRWYRSGETKLARAMTISGAAASTAMGSKTFFAQAFAMTVFNARLGQWIENPAYRGGARAWRREGWVFWPRYLLWEMLASTDSNRRLIHVSDGGHTGDNLGIYPLLQRRCRLILAGDAEADGALTFGSFTEALRQARIDLRTEVEIDLAPIRKDTSGGLSTSHFALGRISYPATATEPASGGWLLLVKNSVTPKASEIVKNYHGAHASFPHQTTADQFFDEAQFESYRELGEVMMLEALGPGLREALGSRPGWVQAWRRELPPEFAALV